MVHARGASDRPRPRRPRPRDRRRVTRRDRKLADGRRGGRLPRRPPPRAQGGPRPHGDPSRLRARARRGRQATIDCDFSHDPTDLPRLVEATSGGHRARLAMCRAAVREPVRFAASSAAAVPPLAARCSGSPCTTRPRGSKSTAARCWRSRRRGSSRAATPSRSRPSTGAIRSFSVEEVPIRFTDRTVGGSKMGAGIVLEAMTRVPAPAPRGGTRKALTRRLAGAWRARRGWLRPSRAPAIGRRRVPVGTRKVDCDDPAPRRRRHPEGEKRWSASGYSASVAELAQVGDDQFDAEVLQSEGPSSSTSGRRAGPAGSSARSSPTWPTSTARHLPQAQRGREPQT